MDPLDPTRRDFTRALLAVTPLALAAGTAPAQNAETVDALVANVEALHGIVRRRYGKFLTKEQLVDVQKAILRKLRGADILRGVKLKNSDEPAFIFHA